VGLLEGARGDLAGATVAVLGAAYRGGVKETAFSGVFPLVEALTARGATVVVHDPLYSDDELAALGFTPYHFGNEIDAAIIQTDHDEYRSIGPAELPGASAIVDGRRVSSRERWPGVTYRVIGARSPAQAPAL
jgi:UDP-N-acetyl-D-mannosaminuronate dehydrogenase